MTNHRRMPLQRSEEEIIRQDVEDALAATQEERIAAMVVLLDTAYALMARNSDDSLIRPNKMIQERRRGFFSKP